MLQVGLHTRDKHVSLDCFINGSVTAVVCYVYEVIVVILVVAKTKQKNLGGKWELHTYTVSREECARPRQNVP